MRKQMFSICLSLRIFLPMCVIDSKTTCHIIRCAGDYSFEFHRAHRDQVDLQTIKGDIEMVLSRRIRVLPFFFLPFSPAVLRFTWCIYHYTVKYYYSNVSGKLRSLSIADGTAKGVRGARWKTCIRNHSYYSVACVDDGQTPLPQKKIKIRTQNLWLFIVWRVLCPDRRRSNRVSSQFNFCHF